MLSGEAAAKRLEEIAIPKKEIEKRRLERIVQLPEEFRATAYGLMERDAAGKELGYRWDAKNQKKREETLKAAREHLDRMSLLERETVFAALMPKMGRAFALDWNPAASLYQNGYERRAFRVQGRPDLTGEKRWAATQSVIEQLGPYQEQDAAWFATWASYLGWVGDRLGSVFAAVIDGGGDEGQKVFDILLDSARGEHPEGAMGRHVTRALLSASRPDGWEFMEKLLLAAQRQEGLRQNILEAVDEAHPEAFRRMLRLIAEHELMRFSATIRAVDVWFALGWDAPTLKQANAALSTAHDFIFDAEAREKALTTSDDGQTVYLALWAIAFEDAITAMKRATELLNDSLVIRRAAAVRILQHLDLPEAKEALVPALDDEDLRISAMAFETVAPHQHYWYYSNNEDQENESGKTDLFERLERNLSRYPKEAKQLDSILFPWITPTASAEALANSLVASLGDREASRLLPYLPSMDANGRTGVAIMFARKKQPRTDETRDVLVNFLGDASSSVREKAMEGLKRFPADEPVIVAQYEKLLTRKSADLRRNLMELLLKQKDENALASADRLLESRSEPQRVAGLGLLDTMIKKQRQTDAVREKATGFAAKRANPTEAEQALLDILLNVEKEKVTLDDALGLMDPAQISQPVAPKLPEPPPGLISPSTLTILKALDAWVEEHRQVTVRIKSHYGEDETDMLLGDVGWQFPGPNHQLPREEDLSHLPLREEVEDFWKNRPDTMRDPDGFELLRGEVAVSNIPVYGWGDNNPKSIKNAWRDLYQDLTTLKLKHPAITTKLFGWLCRLDCPSTAEAATFLLDAAETSLVHMLEAEVKIFEAQERLGDTPVESKSSKKDTITAELAEALEEVTEFVSAITVEADLSEQLAELESTIDEDNDDDDTNDDEQSEGKKETGNKKDRLIRKYKPGNWRETDRLMAWLNEATVHQQLHPSAWTVDHARRLWNLQLWITKPHPEAERRRAELDPILNAFRLGMATEADIYDCLIGPRPKGEGYYARQDFNALNRLSGRKPDPRFETTPGLREIVDNCRRRVLEVEQKRGDNPTLATDAARSLRYTGGMDVLLSFVKAMGKEIFVRGYSYSGADNKSNVFSQIIRATFPREEDTPEAFAAQAKAEKLPEKRLAEVAMYAPHWAKHVEYTLGWSSFAEGVWWMHAHTKDDQWSVDAEIRETWTAEISDKTPLTAEDLVNGGVDVAWFHRIYNTLGAERWKMLDDAAKYASSSGGHKRAQLFADAMLGRADKDELIARIKDKRNQDAIRALGLIPLPEDFDEKQSETLARYAVIQEFLRTSKQFGAQRQESEKKAARIGLENLARTAGYPDPVRLEWAMEARAVADLAEGPITVTAGEVSVTLSINDLGKPDLVAMKKGKVIQNIPPAAKKDPAIAELVSRRKEIERQASRMRLSLEEAMIRGDGFSGAELAKLWEHPVLQPMLRSLVFVEDAGAEPIIGYPVEGGKHLEDAEGATHTVPPDLRLRIAHPLDLLQTGKWDRWQRDCFLRERIQPFKQVFRELYVLTDQEKADATFSSRYSGHQVNPKQALALLGKRGWVNTYEEGARKTYHEAGISVWLDSVGTTFSPLDVEGFTIEDVRFTRRGEYKSLPLTEVPPRLFSETMRDLDLVVSVAHMGGVDPEASASTVEMRAALVREASTLLKLENVRLEKSHVLIDGQLAQYSIHLGSAIVHRQPGGFVCIVPSHAQHRGRLFLPFADDDPRTAEVVSKVLLLAKDNEIKDPTILEQILAVR